MTKVIKNKTISDIHLIGYDDGSFEISSDQLFDGDSIELDREDIIELVSFLTSGVLYGLVDGKVSPVVYQ